VASIIARINLGYASNLVGVPICLTAPFAAFYDFEEKWPADAFLRLQKIRTLQQMTKVTK
jgi:hypothetical protein|tara:strand:- start:1587 stop:1766 length:180 start_codon:yes stop_codon:yes gene_type:complete